MDLGSVVQEAWQGYGHLQAAHPYLATAIQSVPVFVATDATVQLMTPREPGKPKINLKKLRYTACLAPIYGLSFQGLMDTGFMVKKYVSESTLAMAALGPNLVGNIYNAFFFINNQVGYEKDYEISKLAAHYKQLFTGTPEGPGMRGVIHNIKECCSKHVPAWPYAAATAGTLTFWNWYHAKYSYGALSDETRMPAAFAVGFLWTLAMTAGSSLGTKLFSRRSQGPKEKEYAKEKREPGDKGIRERG
jgi:hypothetical protein